MKNQVTSRQTLIMGPAMIPGNGVLEAVYAMYYLPMSYKLVFPTATPEDKLFREKVATLAQENELYGRVRFGNEEATPSDFTIILSDAIAKAEGESPEAVASAILKSARAAV